MSQNARKAQQTAANPSKAALTNPPPSPAKKPAPLPKHSFLALGFRHLKPSWRVYIEYVRQAAREGDEEMRKFVDAYDSIKPKYKVQSMAPEEICDLCAVKGEDLFAAVARMTWRLGDISYSGILAQGHTRTLEKILHYGTTGAENFNDRRLVMQLAGKLPDKQGRAPMFGVVFNNRVESSADEERDLSDPSLAARGFMHMDREIIDIDRILEKPDMQISGPSGPQLVKDDV